MIGGHFVYLLTYISLVLGRTKGIFDLVPTVSTLWKIMDSFSTKYVQVGDDADYM